MADPKNLSPDELARVLLQAAAAADLARTSGLELAGDLAAIRAEQAKVEAARLRFKHGKDAPVVATVQKTAAIRAERGQSARATGTAARAELDKFVGEIVVTRPVREPTPGPAPTPQPQPGGEPAGGFVIEGRILRGRQPAGGLAVEAIVAAAREATAVSSTTSGADGGYRLAIDDVAKVRRKLGLAAADKLAVTVVARAEGEVVARAAGEIEIVAGGRATANLQFR